MVEICVCWVTRAHVTMIVTQQVESETGNIVDGGWLKIFETHALSKTL